MVSSRGTDVVSMVVVPELPEAAQGQLRNGACGLHAGQTPHAVQQLGVEAPNLFGLAVDDIGQAHAQGKDALGTEAGIDLEDFLEAAEQETSSRR